MQRSPGSEPETHAKHAPAEGNVLHQLVAALIVLEVAVHEADLAPIERIARTGRQLPGQVRVAGAHVGVLGQEPALA